MTCAHCEDLEEQVAYLESELGLRLAADELAGLRATFGLTPSEARAVLALHRAAGRTVTRAQVEEVMPSPTGKEERSRSLLSSTMFHIRRKLGPGIVETVWSAGFRITPAGQKLVASALSRAFA